MSDTLRRTARIHVLIGSPLMLCLMGAGYDAPPEIQQVAQVAPTTEEAPARPQAPETRPAEPDEAEAALVYVPPRRGAPRAKVGGGVRGAPAQPAPLALAPDHVAETLSAQPSLFWHIDAVPSRGTRLVFTLIEAGAAIPIAEVDLATPTRPGIQRIDLSRLGVTLAPGVEFEWSVALVAASGDRSEDRVSSASIRRVTAPLEVAQAAPSARSYAARGLWYDALAISIDAAGASPADADSRDQRDALLRQADLEAAID